MKGGSAPVGCGEQSELHTRHVEVVAKPEATCPRRRLAGGGDTQIKCHNILIKKIQQMP
ncbi:MAG: hypothetical protein N3F09_10765 [Bacteroidia bacterium]|nr:hypothetical protein [Bacteroidia bacterium]